MRGNCHHVSYRSYWYPLRLSLCFSLPLSLYLSIYISLSVSVSLHDRYFIIIIAIIVTVTIISSARKFIITTLFWSAQSSPLFLFSIPLFCIWMSTGGCPLYNRVVQSRGELSHRLKEQVKQITRWIRVSIITNWIIRINTIMLLEFTIIIVKITVVTITIIITLIKVTIEM